MTPSDFLPPLRRRSVLGLGAVWAGTAAAAPAAERSVQRAGVVRIASVATDVDGGLLPPLLEAFGAETGVACSVLPGNDPYGQARAGQADLVISHYGHRDTERFVTEGLGLWPRTVFSNQAALIGPASDPAGVRGLGSLVEAMRRIAGHGSPFIVNHNMGMNYLSAMLWHAAGSPTRGEWWIEKETTGARNGDAVRQAAARGGYTLWGLTPFLRDRQSAADAAAPQMDSLVTADPLLQRLMVAVPVNPTRVPGVNAEGARRLVDYLLAPAVQARIMTTPYAGAPQATWAPAGRHNAGAVLPG